MNVVDAIQSVGVVRLDFSKHLKINIILDRSTRNQGTGIGVFVVVMVMTGKEAGARISHSLYELRSVSQAWKSWLVNIPCVSARVNMRGLPFLML